VQRRWRSPLYPTDDGHAEGFVLFYRLPTLRLNKVTLTLHLFPHRHSSYPCKCSAAQSLQAQTMPFAVMSRPFKLSLSMFQAMISQSISLET
jgi:hypothetical protein